MPWSSGSFTRTNGTNTGQTTWTKDKNAGTKILSVRHDTHDQDLADGIDNCLTKDGQNALTSDMDCGGFKIRNYGAVGTTLAATENGTSTPTISGGSFTYNDQTCEYFRIGKQINFILNISGFWAATPTGSIIITHNIPFTAQTLSGASYPAVVHHANVSTDAFIQAAATPAGEIELYEVGANGARTQIDGADVNGTIIEITIAGTYIKT